MKKETTQPDGFSFCFLNFESSLKLGFFDEMQGAESLSRSARTRGTQASEGFAATKQLAKKTCFNALRTEMLYELS